MESDAHTVCAFLVNVRKKLKLMLVARRNDVVGVCKDDHQKGWQANKVVSPTNRQLDWQKSTKPKDQPRDQIRCVYVSV